MDVQQYSRDRITYIMNIHHFYVLIPSPRRSILFNFVFTSVRSHEKLQSKRKKRTIVVDLLPPILASAFALAFVILGDSVSIAVAFSVVDVVAVEKNEERS